VDATLAMLGDVGYQGLTIEGVATLAGVSKATIYRWWSTKANLVIEAVSHRLQQPPPPSGDALMDIRAMIATLVGIFAGAVGSVLPVLAVDVAGDPDATEKLASVLGPYRAGNTAVLLSAVGRGELPHDIDTTAVLDAIIGTILYRRLMHRPLDSSLVDQLTVLVLNGEVPRLQAQPLAGSCNSAV
jgi:AcrR family transcriptional regulator